MLTVTPPPAAVLSKMTPSPTARPFPPTARKPFARPAELTPGATAGEAHSAEGCWEIAQETAGGGGRGAKFVGGEVAGGAACLAGAAERQQAAGATARAATATDRLREDAGRIALFR